MYLRKDHRWTLAEAPSQTPSKNPDSVELADGQWLEVSMAGTSSSADRPFDVNLGRLLGLPCCPLPGLLLNLTPPQRGSGPDAWHHVLEGFTPQANQPSLAHRVLPAPALPPEHSKGGMCHFPRTALGREQEGGGGNGIRCGEGLSWGPGGRTFITSAALHWLQFWACQTRQRV